MSLIPYTFSECQPAIYICATCPCTIQLTEPIYIGKAMSVTNPRNKFTSQNNQNPDIKAVELKFGQDMEFAVSSRSIPGKVFSEGNEKELKEDFLEGIDAFTKKGKARGMAYRLANAFLGKQKQVREWRDNSYDTAVKKHPNMQAFSRFTLSAPRNKRPKGKLGIHDLLLAANMDISKVKPIENFGTPAFNIGSKFRSTEDFSNGLGVIAHDVQYVYIYATKYCYNQTEKKYSIVLENHVYDVFGLDDEDQEEFGGNLGDKYSMITAWWQLQHQYGYAPLITKAIVSYDYEVFI